MDRVIYALCAVTALTCAALLLRAWARTRVRVLLWAALCFCALTLNNVLLVLDRLMFPTIDFSAWRLSAALVALLLLVGGLIVDADT
jgi:hypothetical protein